MFDTNGRLAASLPVITSLDVIDGSLVAVAERLRLKTIATLNHRDFRVVRPAHIDAFELVL